MNYYVELPSLLGHPSQKLVVTSKRRIREDGTEECYFIPISRGYFKEGFWLSREELRKLCTT